MVVFPIFHGVYEHLYTKSVNSVIRAVWGYLKLNRYLIQSAFYNSTQDLPQKNRVIEKYTFLMNWNNKKFIFWNIFLGKLIQTKKPTSNFFFKMALHILLTPWSRGSSFKVILRGKKKVLWIFALVLYLFIKIEDTELFFIVISQTKIFFFIDLLLKEPVSYLNQR